MVKVKVPDEAMLAAIRDHLAYCPTTGNVYWTKGRRGSARASRGPGTNAGSQRKDGYWSIKLMGQDFLAHRVALYLHTGTWPVAFVDHVNGDTRDNRADNLRPASTAENVFNSKVRRTNKLGIKGVSQIPSGGFTAEIMRDGRRHYLGCFRSPQEASDAYAAAAKVLHGQFAGVR